MTNSELFAVMVGGFSTVSGSVLAAYIGFGVKFVVFFRVFALNSYFLKVPANHLLVASIMSAPAALAIAKLMYPETKKTKADSKAIQNFPKR
jgi:nucleoside permease NupC